MDYSDHEEDFKKGRMDFVFRQTGLLEPVGVGKGDSKLYEGLRKDLGVLDRVVGYVPYETVKAFVLAYKEHYLARRELDRATDRFCDANDQDTPAHTINELHYKMVAAEGRQDEAERAYYDNRFDELRMVMHGKRIRLRDRISTKPTESTKESAAEKAGTLVLGAVGGLWFGFLAVSFVAVLLFGLVKAIKGCKWTPSEYDAQKLEYLP